MENWQLILVTVGALLVGALIPVLLQLRSTLRGIEVDLHETSGGLAPVLEDLRATTHRLRLVADGLEGRERDVGEAVHSAADLGRTLDRMRHTTQIATAVAAAVAAGIRAFRDAHTSADGATEVAGTPAPGTNGRATAWTPAEDVGRQGEPS
jgi:ABC-type transporter Mla subunit MlaD